MALAYPKEGIMVLKRNRITYTQFIALSFLLVILLGSVLLCLPVSSRSGQWTPYIDSLFTATSATCVTGLVVYDTYSHWSAFGQATILCLIQIGGIGFMTVVSMLSVALKRHIGLYERKLLAESTGSLRVGGVVVLLKRIIAGTVIFEGAGTVLLATRFCPEMGFGKGLYNALFHSVSAFCNAGFDIMGKYGRFSSLTKYADDVVVNLTIMALIVIGGIGFFVWSDIFNCRFHFRKYQLHTKIVLTSTAALIFVSVIAFFIMEYDHAFKGMPLGEKMIASGFQAISPRTAGFNTVDLNSLSESGGIFTIILMFIGGSPGSTAGGIKTTTFVVLIMEAIASARSSQQVTVFKKRLDESVLRQASAIATIYLLAITVSTLAICMLEPFSFKKVLFEVVSAIGTVGLTLGITPMLGAEAKIILMILMFAGRVGGLSFALVIAQKRTNVPINRPTEKIMVG